MRTATKTIENTLAADGVYLAWAALNENDLLDSDLEPETDPYAAELVRRLAAQPAKSGSAEALADVSN